MLAAPGLTGEKHRFRREATLDGGQAGVRRRRKEEVALLAEVRRHRREEPALLAGVRRPHRPRCSSV